MNRRPFKLVPSECTECEGWFVTVTFDRLTGEEGRLGWCHIGLSRRVVFIVHK